MSLRLSALHLDRVPVLALVTAALSNLVSNVPAVRVLRPLVGAAGGADRAWLTLAMAATVAGNLTILGSVANLIVVQGARAKWVTIGFWTYFRVGAPFTLLTIALGAYWLSSNFEPFNRPQIHVPLSVVGQIHGGGDVNATLPSIVGSVSSLPLSATAILTPPD
jgi:hypothetical protein